MTALSIRTYGDPVLRKRAKEITKVDEKIRNLASKMLRTLKDAGGIGLAATQVGEELRIFVVDRSQFQLEDSPLIVINPVVVNSRGEQTEEEGCLSLPGTYADVTRPLELTVRGMDLDEKEMVIEAKGVLSRVLAHEIDHLDGVLFVDHLGSLKRRLLSKKLKQLSAGKQ
ncbi:MAG: peptide deformylase [Candidatus Zixiibacteriota bacterium]|nr:MAG: peptide deformylase [candidate division Zixibacteria bacterium]